MASSRLERIGTIMTRVEGLISRGGMKPDERPLWFDVYRRFPPISEPKFAKPKPENIPIRPILYQEDTLRAQFHSKGHGLSAVNMLSTQGETHTKKLIQAYTKLRAEGVSEDELIEKSVSAVDNERKMEQTQSEYKMKPLNPASVTAQVLAEANIKNIFSDKE